MHELILNMTSYWSYENNVKLNTTTTTKILWKLKVLCANLNGKLLSQLRFNCKPVSSLFQ